MELEEADLEVSDDSEFSDSEELSSDEEVRIVVVCTLK